MKAFGMVLAMALVGFKIGVRRCARKQNDCLCKIDKALRLAKQGMPARAEAEEALKSIHCLKGEKPPNPTLAGDDDASRALVQLLVGVADEDSEQRSGEHQALSFGFGLLSIDEHLDTWDFDASELDRQTSGTCLSTLAFCVLGKAGLVDAFKIDEIRLIRFLAALERMYPQHPYHNRMHVAEVLHVVHRLATVSNAFPPLQRLALYFAACIHDVDHKGVTNDFLVRSSDHLAITYNDNSPMENHHVAVAFRLLQRSDMNFLSQLKRSDFVLFRRMVVDVVLATDMRRHFEIMDQCKAIADEEHLLLMKVVMKFADLSHTTRSGEKHLKQVGLLEEEYFQQGDQEAKLGWHVSALMDRGGRGMSASQTKFFDVIVMPLLELVVDHVDGAMPVASAVLANKKSWETKAEGVSQDLPTQPPVSLLAAVGGLAGIVDAVDRFYSKVLADSAVSKAFEGVDMNVLRQKQVRFLKHAFGEGEPLDIEKMRVIHARVTPKPGLTEFGIIVNHFVASMQEIGVPQATVELAVQRLSPLAAAFTHELS